MDSLLDIGEVVRTGLALQNTRENTRRNDLAERGLFQEQQRIDLQQQQQDLQKQQATRAVFEDLTKLMDRPEVRADRTTHATIIKRALQLSGFPDVSDDTIQRNLERMDGLVKDVKSRDPEKVTNAIHGLAVVLPPDDFSKVATGLQGVAKFSEYFDNVAQMRELQSTRTEAIHNKQSKINAAQLPLENGVRDTTLALSGTDSKEFKAALNVINTIPKEKRTDPYATPGVQALTDFAKPKMEQEAEYFDTQAGKYLSAVQRGKQLLELKQASGELPADVPKTLTERDLIEQVSVGQTMVDAYTTIAAWKRDPFDKSKLKAAQAAQATVVKQHDELKKVKGGLDEDVQAMRREALAFREGEAGKKHVAEQSQHVGQDQYLKFLADGDDPKLAARKAAAVAKEETGVLPDSSKFSDPGKKGKLEVGIMKMGQEDLTRQFKTIEGAEMALGYIDELREVVRTNPAIVGRAAQFGTAIAGAGQQLRALVSRDPSASKFLNTKPRDNAEALYEVLVYAQAKAMDPTGALDLKVVQNARETIGSLDGFSTGPQQMLNKLDQIERMASRNIRRARRRLSGGVQSFLQDEPYASGGKPLSEMTEEELMQQIVGGANP